MQALRALEEPLGLRDDLSLSVISRFSDIFTVNKETEDEDAVWADVLQVADEATGRFVQMRETEGAKMKEEWRAGWILSCRRWSKWKRVLPKQWKNTVLACIIK